jgi:hypothetical protein
MRAFEHPVWTKRGAAFSLRDAVKFFDRDSAPNIAQMLQMGGLLKLWNLGTEKRP